MKKWSHHVFHSNFSSFLSVVTFSCEMRMEKLRILGKRTTKIVTLFFVMVYMMDSFVENISSFPLGNQFPNFHGRWAEKSGNGVQLIKEIELCSDFSVISWYQCMKLDDDKKSPKLRLGIAAWTHWSTLVVPFHFAAWFPKREICKGIDCFNRGKIKTKLLTFPAAAHASELPEHYKVYTPC